MVNDYNSEHNVENIGTEAAAITALEAIRQFKPDVLISAGTCGGFKDKGSRIGDVYISKKICYFDRRISINSDYHTYGEGSYYASQAEVIAEALGLKTATVCTGSSFDMSPIDEDILRQEPLVAKDIEAAAIASVAKNYDIPLLAVTPVTDLVDEDSITTEQFLSNLSKASELYQLCFLNTVFRR